LISAKLAAIKCIWFVGIILDILRYFHSLEQFINIYLDTLRRVLLMKSDRLYTLLKTNLGFVIPAILTLSIIIIGGIGVYLAEHEHQGANIKKLGDAFWWAVVTITTVGYGDYYPVTSVGRIIAIFVMFSGIGIVVSFLGTLTTRRLRRVESRFKSATEVQPRLLGDETKTAVKNKIEVIDKMTEEDFDTLIVMIKSLRRTLLEESKILFKCSRCGNPYHSKPKFCSNCGLDLT
jgi:voltage-gated potassium channel